MSGMSSVLTNEIARQVQVNPDAVQMVVREVYAEVFGQDEWEAKVAEMGIDLSRYGVRAIWEFTGNPFKQTGAIVGVIEYDANEANGRMDLYFKFPSRELYEQVELAFCKPGRYIGRVPANKVVKTREGAVDKTEAVDRAYEHLRAIEDYIRPFIGIRRARKWIEVQSSSLAGLLKE